MDGKLYVVTSSSTAPGQPARSSGEDRDVLSGQLIDKRARLDGRDRGRDSSTGPFSTTPTTPAAFMDSENYEQITLGGELDALRPPEHHGRDAPARQLAREHRAAGQRRTGVTDTPPGIKAPRRPINSRKPPRDRPPDRVPPFISNGETIRVATADGTYQSHRNPAGRSFDRPRRRTAPAMGVRLCPIFVMIASAKDNELLAPVQPDVPPAPRRGLVHETIRVARDPPMAARRGGRRQVTSASN